MKAPQESTSFFPVAQPKGLGHTVPKRGHHFGTTIPQPVHYDDSITSCLTTSAPVKKRRFDYSTSTLTNNTTTCIPQHYARNGWIEIAERIICGLRFIEHESSSEKAYLQVIENDIFLKNIIVPPQVASSINEFYSLLLSLKCMTQRQIHETLELNYQNKKADIDKSEFIEQLPRFSQQIDIDENTIKAINDWLKAKNELHCIEHQKPISIERALTQVNKAKTLYYYEANEERINILEDLLRVHKMIGPGAERKPWQWTTLRCALEKLHFTPQLTSQEASELISNTYGVDISRQSFDKRVDQDKTRRSSKAKRFYSLLIDELGFKRNTA
jgi:hypothetical protein